MSVYLRDRFGGLGLITAVGEPLYSPPSPGLTTVQLPTVESSFAQSMAEALAKTSPSSPTVQVPLSQGGLLAVASITKPKGLTEQQKAEAELERLLAEQTAAEEAWLRQQALDIGEPEKKPILLYVGIGVGALALIGGVLAATRKKPGKVAGYRRRRRR